MNKDQQLPHDLTQRLRLLDVMDRITQIGLAGDNMEDVLGGVLDMVLGVFNADRAWFLYPCDPIAPSWGVPMERTRPEWPGLGVLGKKIPMTRDISEIFRELLSANHTIQYGLHAGHSLPSISVEQFSVKSQLMIVLRPKIGNAWGLGLHHCESEVKHDEQDLHLFETVAQRISESLSSLISIGQLRESETRLSRALEATSDGLWDWDLRSGLAYLSPRYYEMTGYRPDEVTPNLEFFKSTVHPDDLTAVLESVEAHLQGKTPSSDMEYRLITRSGEIMWTMGRGRVVERDAAGVPIRMVGTITDISRIKLAERKLHNLAAHLQSVREEEKANIAREIHDDLGGTLTALKMQAHWLKSELSAYNGTALLLDHVESMSQLIDSATVTMRNIITGLRPTILDDLGLLAALEWQAEQFHRHTGIKCLINCIGNKGGLDKHHSIALFRVSQEALTNVLRHSGASRVEIEYHHSDEEIVISIIDNGRGMTKSNADASICYGIHGMRERVDQLGGKIDFDTPPGGGFNVTVIVPLAADKAVEA